MFRIYIYLSFLNFLRSFFFNNKWKIKKKISKIILRQSEKKYFEFSSQCRISFLYILKFLKKENKDRNEIIFSAYNLPEMINIAKNLKYKIRFCDLNYESGFVEANQILKKINKKTKVIVLTNMFNNWEQSMRIKKLANKKKIFLIEDNAIYFDNFSLKKNKKNYSGSLGDFTIYSFNIMKNISGLFGGAIATNNKQFINYYNFENQKNNSFFKSKLISQIIIFIILKVMSIRILYKNLFIFIIEYAHKKKIGLLLKLFYPSLNFKIIKFPKYYFTKISSLTVKLVYLQINNYKKRLEVFYNRKKKNIYYFKKISKIKNKNIDLIKVKDFNYQNFLDFPVLVKNKEKLNLFLLKKGIETKFIHYKNCEKLFHKKNYCKNSSLYEKKLICLPNHEKISFQYIDEIVKNLKKFFNEK